MWGRLSDVINNSKGLSIDKALFFVFSNEFVQAFTIELNTQGQLFEKGIDSEGIPLKDIGGDYADFTKDIKLFENLPIDRVTLFQEGDFYKSFNIVPGPDGITIEADTLKEGDIDLRERWGQNILGLTDESRKKLIEEIAPLVIEYILHTLLS